MSRHQVAGGLTVRGTCAAGHVTEATTDKGRTTWEGDCARDGCELPVKARTRVAGAPPPPPADTPAADPPANDPPVSAAPKPKPKVKQVDYDAQPAKRAQPRRRSAGGSTKPREPASPTAPVHHTGPDADDGGGQPAGGGVATERRSRIRERITGRREAGPPAKAAREFRLPF